MSSVFDRLDHLLDGFLHTYDALISAVGLHQAGVRQADGNMIADAAERQSQLHRVISDLDRTRRELVVEACSCAPDLAGKHPAAVTLRDVAAAAPHRQRLALSSKADRLRELVRRAHEETRTIRAATVSVLAHLEGLIRQVGRQLSHAGTYTRRGFVEQGGVVVSALDLKM